MTFSWICQRNIERSLMKSEILSNCSDDRQQETTIFFSRMRSKNLAKKLSLTQDCRTWRNSLVDMLSRFQQLKGPVPCKKHSLTSANSLIDISDGDYDVISDMLHCLEPLKLTVTALCRCDTNLLSAEAVLKICMIQLQKQSSELAKTLADFLGCRIQERHGMHAAVLQYLHTNTARQGATDVFTIPTNVLSTSSFADWLHEWKTPVPPYRRHRVRHQDKY